MKMASGNTPNSRFPQLRTVNTINIPITRTAYTVLQFSEGTELC